MDSDESPDRHDLPDPRGMGGIAGKYGVTLEQSPRPAGDWAPDRNAGGHTSQTSF